MEKISSITIINNKNLRGVLAPAKVISKKTLEDIIDFIELSSPKALRETEKQIKQADRDQSWIPAKEIEKRLKNRMKSSKSE
ncbi:hypothetical protein MYX06_03485 [Patescibacteria group bacterium AH-259-L05]|nr:hypothetical protein [Patescibacteria group bacterium AH-259-L05]